MSSSAYTPAGTGYDEAGSGPALVFAHGVGMNRDVWAPQVQRFAVSHRVLTYDMLGHGTSPLPPQRPRLADLSDQLDELLTSARIASAALVGHSMGALVAIDFALRQPAKVSRLIAMNAVFGRSPAQRKAVARRAGDLRDATARDNLDQTLSRWFGAAEQRRAAPAVARVREWLQTTDPTGYARIYELFATADDAFTARLGELAMPALFMTGERDPNSTPSMTRRMAECAPLGHADVLTGERHMMALVSPGVVNERIAAFLRADDTRSMPYGGSAAHTDRVCEQPPVDTDGRS